MERSFQWCWKLFLKVSNTTGNLYNINMTNEELRAYLETKKDSIERLKVLPRDLTISPTPEFITSIIGPRRAGKTYSMYYLIKKNQLDPSDFIFLNFEDIGIDNTDAKIIERSIAQHAYLYGKEPKWIFLDEIHNLQDWQREVYTIYERKTYKIVISGSTSKLTSREMASYLRGRSLSVPVFPFSFKEILNIHEFQKRDLYSLSRKPQIMRLFERYLQNGGFPQIWLEEDVNPLVFFQNYVETIVFKDIVERYRIKNPQIFRSLLPILASSNAKEISIKKLYHTFESKGFKLSKSSFYNYTYYLEEIFVIYLLRKLRFSERESQLSVPKLYFLDTGLVNYLHSTSYSSNFGRSLETVVFVELLKKKLYGEIFGLFYWKNLTGEIDFLIKKTPGKVSDVIQVTDVTSREELEDRELRMLAKSQKIFPEAKKLIITRDFTGEINGIECVSILNWLLSL